MDALTGIPWGSLGPSGLVTMFVVLIFTGRVVTRSVHQEALDDRDRYRALAETLAAQNSQLMNVSNVAVHALQSIDRRSAEVDADRDGVA